MKVVNSNAKAISLSISLSLFDKLQPNASFVSQIPESFKNFQTKAQPYFIMERNPLLRILSELREKELNSNQQTEIGKLTVLECSEITGFVLKEKPVLIFFSFSA